MMEDIVYYRGKVIFESEDKIDFDGIEKNISAGMKEKNCSDKFEYVQKYILPQLNGEISDKNDTENKKLSDEEINTLNTAGDEAKKAAQTASKV